MRLLRILFCLILFIIAPLQSLLSAEPAPPSSSQTVSELQRLLPPEFAGRKPSGPDRVFTRNTISGYVGKASDIYLGFSFRLLLVREYRGDEAYPLSVEIFDMSTSGDAFGIYSHDLTGEPASVGQEARYRAGTLRFWKGNLFVRLSAEADSAESRRSLVGLGLHITALATREGARPRILSCLPRERLVPETIRYFHKQVSLDTHYYLADQNVLLLDERTEVALANYSSGRGHALLLLCRYQNPEDAYRALRQFSQVYFPGKPGASGRRIVEEIDQGEIAGILQTNAFLVIVLESSDRETCESLLQAAESRIREEFSPQRRTP